ncbi:secreted protein of Ly-6 domain 1-like [Neofelis nebulosa]|uniref:secreted protein of Ly-6 domain 1-like n=1 Tax=Neofelis nebulosa TaxID=61452 RepID=UPI00272C8F4E|nr:secreted protein of Ly-6 domain 1-like [Neofelis nebulosa]
MLGACSPALVCQSSGLGPNGEMGHCLLLLLLLVLSSQLGFLQALPCFQCPRVNASGVCETGESVCETQGSQRCFLRKVYEDDTLSYGYQGCSSVCFPLMLFNPAVTLEERCCNDSPFCNKF